MSLFVITKIGNTSELAGIPHSHAVKNLHGSAVFGFNNIRTAAKVARAIDHRMKLVSETIFTEDLMEPISNLALGQEVKLKKYYAKQKTKLDKVSVCKVTKEHMSKYASAMHTSVIFLDEKDDILYVEDILSPVRDFTFSAAYLQHLYDTEI